MSLEYAIYFLLAFVLDAVIGAAFLWIGMKVVARFVGMMPGAEYCSYSELLIAVAAASVASLLPGIGWLASIIVLFVLLRKFTSAGVGEIIGMVLISRVAAIILLIPLLS